jgi:hypothetical protein
MLSLIPLHLQYVHGLSVSFEKTYSSFPVGTDHFLPYIGVFVSGQPLQEHSSSHTLYPLSIVAVEKPISICSSSAPLNMLGRILKNRLSVCIHMYECVRLAST